MRDPTVDESLEWRDLRHKEEELRAEMKDLQEHNRLPLAGRRRQKDIRRELDTVMAAQREMAMDYWKEAVGEKR